LSPAGGASHIHMPSTPTRGPGLGWQARAASCVFPVYAYAPPEPVVVPLMTSAQ